MHIPRIPAFLILLALAIAAMTIVSVCAPDQLLHVRGWFRAITVCGIILIAVFGD